MQFASVKAYQQSIQHIRPSLGQRDRQANRFLDGKTVWLHLLFKLHCPVVRWSVGLLRVFVSALKQTSTKKPPHWHETGSSVSPRTLTSWERFVHHSLCLPLPPYVPLTADLLRGCGVEWVHHGLLGGPQFVRFLSGWFTPGYDQRVLSPGRVPLMAWNWDQPRHPHLLQES